MKLTSIAKNVFARTAPNSHYPEFVSVNEHVDGTFSFNVRSPRESASCGPVAPRSGAH
ncbi:hypothetical protein ABIG06_006889 [Bradyrhizobium sp. USDA 326]